MKNTFLYFLAFLSIFPLSSCKKSQQQTIEVDNKSYINDFELVQENSMNDTQIKIRSPKAIIDPLNNDIEIFDSSIQIINKDGNDVLVKSGKSIINNSKNIIQVYNNVYISLLETKDAFIRTHSFNWDLNTSLINLDNPLDLNFNNTKITATKGSYNIDSKLLIIDNSNFIRNIYKSDGTEHYRIEIRSDNAQWYKENNSIEFSSNNKQVESTIEFLSLK